MGKKVIRLTESDIENIVRTILDEQNQQSNIANATQNTLELPNFDKLFKIGQYEDTDGSIAQAIEAQIPKIVEFIQNNPQNPKFIAQIVAGESQITNPAGFEQKGSLALARAKTVADIFNTKMSDLIEDETLNVVVPSIEEVKIGTTAYDRTEFVKACGARKEKMDTPECQNFLKPYNQEQFISIKVAGQGSALICNAELQIKGRKAPAPNFEYIYEKELGVNREMTGIKFKAFTIPDRPIIISDKGERSSPPYFTRETKSRNVSDERRYYLELAMLKFLYPDSPAFAGVETISLYQSAGNSDVPPFMRMIDSEGSSRTLGKQFIQIAENIGATNNEQIKKVIDEINTPDSSTRNVTDGNRVKKVPNEIVGLSRDVFNNNFESLFKPMWMYCPVIKTQNPRVFSVTREMTETVKVGSFAPLDETIFSITAVCS